MSGNKGILRRRIGILGGAFNPVHIGHLRIALECSQLLAADHFLLMPTAVPPHKSSRNLLPFALRCELLEAAIKDLPPLRVSRIEGERREASFTWDTLGLLQQEHMAAQLFFVVGCEDFSKLPSWRHGLDLPFRAHLCVVPRGHMAEDVFLASAGNFWPEARASAPVAETGKTLEIPGPKGISGHITYLDIPFLPVSATGLREGWLQGKNIRFLLPDAAFALLEERRPEIDAIWGSNEVLRGT